ncbi:MAG: hypothetical protein CVV42_04175 [Candidatus Riflebacteria bacterium HGW-Riflebacteria-2]|jgi:hypothetical protein|nr:MAG: hypothetical protein CVV42_04175 [Candidatus Riflebacteria bacterium HGW-Riflebacteria-2]
MKKAISVTLLILTALLFAGASLWADEKIIIPGEPPITAFAVDCHIRLIEFVLTSRLTVGQKDAFLAEITRECAEMTTEEKADFLEAVALVDSLSELDEEQLEVVQADLADDFARTAAEVPEDVASQLFNRLQKESSQKVFQEGEILITVQAVDAFVEYLAFLAQPDQPVWYDASATASIKDTLTSNFAGLSHAEKDVLEDFQAGWYMIRAAWQNIEDQKKKDAWRQGFAACGNKPGVIPDIKIIKAALAEKVFAELIDTAGEYGVEPYEWAAELGVRVW